LSVEAYGELFEGFERAREAVRKHYPKAFAVSLAGPSRKYEFTASVEDLGRSVTGSVRCGDEVCEASVFVGWPPDELRREFDAYARVLPQCKAEHALLIENGSVLYCREPLGAAMDRLVEMLGGTVSKLRELERGRR
jgi:hypothetical protein